MAAGLGMWKDPTRWGGVNLWENATTHALYIKHHDDNESVLSDTDGTIFAPYSDHVYYLVNGDKLQTGIDTLTAAGGLVYILPAYTENISTGVVVADNVTILCPTRDAVITDTAGNLTTGMIIGYAGTTGKNDVTISGVQFVGSGTTAGIFVDYSCHRWLIEYCKFSGMKYGIQGYERSPYNTGLIDSRIVRCDFDTCATYGILCQGFNRVVIDQCHLDGGGTGDYGMFIGSCTDVIVRDTYAYDHQYHGFYITSWRRGPGIVLRGCHAWGNGQHGYWIRGNSTAWRGAPKLFNCHAERNSRHGFMFDGNNGINGLGICVGCVAIDNSWGTANGYSGFYLHSVSERIILHACKAYKRAAAEQKYGFEIVAGADKCEVRGGMWSPNQTASWLDNGTDTIITARPD